MKTEEVSKTKEVTQKIQLVKGEFTPSEAAHIVTNLIDEKINFHKLQRLQVWEGDHKRETNQLDNRIEELEKEKTIAKEYIKSLRASGKNLTINGTLEISAVK
ncbi:hypothetical protein [Aquimarina brevivitae]|uniref:Uncharacterized protein n=1 Tax=Aquimarina brevivitae TaxID=323412 RepID=A0A4Q7P519_9FLAO|nr:hypothetical protein [Aquimarina brevivitae]RZS93802.1 hypothetical protein EV197_2383 [Aquimarina brevivitae]